MKKTQIIFLLFLTFMSSAWAFQMPAQPESCDLIPAIQATPFALAQPFNDGKYGAIQVSNYNTRDTWAFVVANITATSSAEAITKATKALSSLSFNLGPVYLSQQNIWACLYNINSGYQAVAITPLPTQMINTNVLFNAMGLG